MSDKKASYMTKQVVFSGKKLTLFSLDGVTWSSRKEELVEIQNRHESERLTFGEIRGLTPHGNKPAKDQNNNMKKAPVLPQANAKPEKGKPVVKEQPKAESKPSKKEIKVNSKPAPKKRASTTPAKKTGAKNKKRAA